jgi:hypothetical protein
MASYALSRLTNSQHYVWVDSSGNRHFINQLQGPVASELSFLIDGEEQRQIYSIPTIQNIDYSQTVNLPTHPTLVGGFKTQFTKSNPATVTFDIILKEDLFINYDVLSASGTVSVKTLTIDEVKEIWEQDEVSMDEVLADSKYFTVKELIDVLESLKDNRRVFTLTTNTDLDDLLDNLVIDSMSYGFASDARYITSCTISAVRVQFQDLEYVDVDEAYLNNILVQTEPLSSENTITYLENVYIDGASKFAKWTLIDRNMYNEMSTLIRGEFGNIPEYYWKSQIVDMKVDGSATYTFDLSFESNSGINSNIMRQNEDVSYTCNFGRFRVRTTYRSDDAPFEPLLLSNSLDVLTATPSPTLNKIPGLIKAGIYLYDVGDIYSMLATYDWVLPNGYSISDEPKVFRLKALNAIYGAPKHMSNSFEKASIAQYKMELYGFKINKSYSYQVEYLDSVTRQWLPVRNTAPITTVWGSPQLEFFTYDTRMTLDTSASASLLDNKSKEGIDNYWDDLLGTTRTAEITIAVLGLGTQVEVFIFSPYVLTVKNVKSIISEETE